MEEPTQQRIRFPSCFVCFTSITGGAYVLPIEWKSKGLCMYSQSLGAFHYTRPTCQRPVGIPQENWTTWANQEEWLRAMSLFVKMEWQIWSGIFRSQGTETGLSIWLSGIFGIMERTPWVKLGKGRKVGGQGLQVLWKSNQYTLYISYLPQRRNWTLPKCMRVSIVFYYFFKWFTFTL